MVVKCDEDISWINIEMWEIFYEEPLLHFTPNKILEKYSDKCNKFKINQSN